MLGVDGGQSAIRLRHSLSDQVIEVAGISHQEGETVDAVAEAVCDAWRQAGAQPVDRVVLGLTTAPADRDTRDRLCRLVATGCAASEVWLADDAVTAHAGALSLGWGVSLIVGTGVACLSLPERGSPWIVGGHGYLLGDEGGGFWIGRQGLEAALRAAEGRGPGSSLTELAERRYGPLAGLPARLHGGERPVDRIARFAVDVLTAADDHDAVATGIVDAAAVELQSVTRAAAAWAHGGGPDPVPLALGGRLLEPGTTLRRRFEGVVSESDPDLVVRSADGSPLEGAIRLGITGASAIYGDLIHRWPREHAA